MSEVELLIRALSLRDELPKAEEQLLRDLPMRVRSFSRGDTLIASGARSTESCLMLSGFSCRELYVEDGKRQIAGVHIGGDFVDLHALLLKIMDHAVVALSDCRAAFVPHAALVGVTQKAPHLTRLLWMSTVIDAAIQRAWITSMGRRSAVQRAGHLICELYTRMDAVGLASRHTLVVPFTQRDLADMLGLSDVHVNRTLRDLRARSLIRWEQQSIIVPDFQALADMAEFDPTYLNLVRVPR